MSLNRQIRINSGKFCKYELIQGNSVVQTEIEEYKIRIYSKPDFLLNLLKETGFSEVRLVKAFDRKAKPHPSDESYVFECRK